MAQTQTKPQIRRKENIPEEARTPDRDKAADAIEDMWPATLGEISDESGYSVSHVHNTLDKYFERYTERDEEEEEPENSSNDARAQPGEQGNQRPQMPVHTEEGRHEVDIPDSFLDNPVQLHAYLKGWADGFVDCRMEYKEEQSEQDNDGDNDNDDSGNNNDDE